MRLSIRRLLVLPLSLALAPVVGPVGAAQAHVDQGGHPGKDDNVLVFVTTWDSVTRAGVDRSEERR